MTITLRKRPKLRSGIERAPKRDWPRHERFVRSFQCLASEVDPSGCEGPVVFAHMRLGAKDNGKGIKPHSAHGVPLCDGHHRESHNIGEATFAAKYKLGDLQKIARKLAFRSPVMEVVAYARDDANWRDA